MDLPNETINKLTDSSDSSSAGVPSNSKGTTDGVATENPIDGVATENLEKMGKRKRSEVWSHFLIISNKDKKGNIVEKWQCKYCKKTYNYQKSGSTTNCSRHIKVCTSINHPLRKQKFFGAENVNIVEDDLVESMCLPSTYDTQKIRSTLAKFIITSELPFSIVEDPYFNIYSKTLCPNFQKISRNTIRKDCIAVYEKEREKLKKAFKAIDRFALTCDCWTSNQCIGYLCITAHFIDVEWRLQHRILSFLDLDPPHTSSVLAHALNNTITQWGIHKKIIAITLDNAKANDGAAASLKRGFENSNRLYFKGKFFHVRCCAHVLNLIIQDGLKSIDKIISIVRDGIIYIKKAASRLKNFSASAQLLGVTTTRGLSSDVRTHWNSTYHMLDSAFHYRYVLHDFFHKDLGLPWLLDDVDWARFSKIRSILEFFDNATKNLSGTSYPTSNLFLPELIGIKHARFSN